jgi:hypothetical protein
MVKPNLIQIPSKKLSAQEVLKMVDKHKDNLKEVIVIGMTEENVMMFTSTNNNGAMVSLFEAMKSELLQESLAQLFGIKGSV